jgi:short-subunit dehydrogenase/SAM-dependent methyltransferase/acyl carrier protein
MDAGPAVVVPTLRRNTGERLAILTSLAKLYELGFDINWPDAHGTGRVVDVPGYVWDRRPHWVAAPAPRSESPRAVSQPEPDVFYEVQWKVKGRLTSAVPRQTPHYIGDSSVIARRLIESRRRFMETPASTGAELDRICRLFAVRALCSIGGTDRIDRARLQEQIVLPRATRLVARLVRTLESIGWLVPVSNGWRVAAPADDPVVRLERLMGADQPSEPIARLLGNCGPRLADALTGAIDPVSLLFPDDRIASAERIYTESLFARSGNALVAQAVAAALENLPQDRVVRALEIGAGTGATTAEIIELFPEDRADYLFTDVSSAFFQKARQHFDRHRVLRYAALDIEKGLQDQGFGSGQLDLVIAANVLHATTDLRATLDAVRRLLVPGGLLVLLEGAASREWVDLTFGLTDGWWKFAGTDGRDYPLLSGSGWCETLQDSGFTNCESVPVSNTPTHSLFPQSVVLARTSASGSATAPSAVPGRRAEEAESVTWCVFADKSGVAEGMRRRIAERGHRVVLVAQGNEFHAVGDRVQIRPDRAEDFDALLAGPLAEDGRVRCVYLWPLDAGKPVPANSNWEYVESNVCGPVVHLIGSLTRARRAASAGLWLVTRGTEARDAEDIALSQSPLWGLGRVVALEHPEQWGGLIDLDVVAAVERDAAALVEEIERPDGEDQMALRGGERFVPRLVRTAMTGGRPSVRLRRDRAYFITGGTGGLGVQLARWMAENGAGWLVLGSRRATPMRDEVSAALRDIERAGAVVEVVAVDVAEMSSVRAVMDSFGRERPKLGGIVHAAGVIETHAVDALPRDAFHRVMQPKVAGAWNLHLLSTAHAPDFFVMFSSAASVWGSVGLAHYSAANYFLDTLARFRERSGLPATCANWGWWEGGGTTEEQHAYYAQIGLEPMSSARALEAFAAVLASGRTQTIVASLDESRFNAVYQARRARALFEHINRPDQRRRDADDEPGAEVPLIEQLRSAPDDQGVALLSSHIREMVAGVLGLSRHRAIDDAEGFFELGMDSIMTVELRTRLQEMFGCSLPVTIAFEYPNVRALTKFIASEIGLRAASPVVVSVPVQSGETTMLEELSNRSEDELAALLDESIAGALGDVTEDRR